VVPAGYPHRRRRQGQLMVDQIVVRFSPRPFVRVQRQRLAPVDLIAPPVTVPSALHGSSSPHHGCQVHDFDSCRMQGIRRITKLSVYTALRGPGWREASRMGAVDCCRRPLQAQVLTVSVHLLKPPASHFMLRSMRAYAQRSHVGSCTRSAISRAPTTATAPRFSRRPPGHWRRKPSRGSRCGVACWCR
jgi:hypothetical protein